jgi:glycerol-3-phosphate dehydrogenase (NAD(P)+)
MDEHVGVIGAGSWGTTLAKVLGDNGRQVLLWARRQDMVDELNQRRVNSTYLPDVELPANVRATTELREVAETAHLLLFVVPSHGFRKAARELGDFVNGEHVIVHATKGIEEGSDKRMSEVLHEETCVKRIGVLSGPNLAKELAARHPTGTLVASRYDEVYTRSAAVLNNDYFRVYGGRDLVGAEVGGSFKNIVALASGAAAGMGLGENTKALLLTRGLSEMARLGVSMGGELLTFGGMAGMGD